VCVLKVEEEEGGGGGEEKEMKEEKGAVFCLLFWRNRMFNEFAPPENKKSSVTRLKQDWSMRS